MTGAPPLLSLAQVATRLDVSAKTVYRLAQSRTLVGCKVGRIWKFDPRHVEQYLDRQRAAVRVVPIATAPRERARRRMLKTLRPGEPELKRPGADFFL